MKPILFDQENPIHNPDMPETASYRELGASFLVNIREQQISDRKSDRKLGADFLQNIREQQISDNKHAKKHSADKAVISEAREGIALAAEEGIGITAVAAMTESPVIDKRKGLFSRIKRWSRENIWDASVERDNSVLNRSSSEKKREGVGRKIGRSVVALTVLTTAFYGTTFVRSLNDNVKRPAAAAEAPNPSTTTTTEMPSTTTTIETPLPPFEAQPGQVMAEIDFPTLCNESVKVLEVSHADGDVAAIDNKGSIPMSPIDQLVPDTTPTADCAQTLDHQKQTGGKTRAQWAKSSSGGRAANYWEAIAGHDHGSSVYPGQIGNAVIFGHGSTFSAPFTNIDALNPNDPVIVKRSDGHVFEYKVIGTDILPASNSNDPAAAATLNNHLYNYTNPNVPNQSFITMYRCGDNAGRSGSDATRVAVHAYYVGRIS